ncbi:MAG: AAA family ATPase [Deltaproteobacteria bacterium]|nr:AAA family ATPase [Deltaproteobacteria bacterium]
MQKIAIYGKGGIGKSTIAAHMSIYYALSGKKVLHVGCDPKHDSSLRLLDGNAQLKTVLDVIGDRPTAESTEELINTGRLGIDCCETGGPPPGLGCGGRGVARTLEFMADMDVFNAGKYDIVIFDVLGDVVCGGFAAPLRLGYAEKVFIVLSEEPMALYAANNISKAIHFYAENGVSLGGFIANLRNNSTNVEFLRRFARELNTELLAVIKRDELIGEAEKLRKTVIEYKPEAEISNIFKNLAETIVSLDSKKLPLPTPIEEEKFFDLLLQMR